MAWMTPVTSSGGTRADLSKESNSESSVLWEARRLSGEKRILRMLSGLRGYE